MLKQRLINMLADTAVEHDTYSVLSRKTLLDRVENRLWNISADKRDKAAYAMDSEQVARREFLQMLGFSAVVGAVGAGTVKLLSDMDHQSVVGYAVGSENMITVPARTHESSNIGSGETFSNKLIDQSANGAGYTIKPSGDDWEILNVGWKGTGKGQYATGNGQHINGVSGNGVVDTVYIEGYNGTQMGGIRASPGHSGVVEVRHTNIQGMGNNAAYCSAPAKKGGGGKINFYRCFHRDNTVSNYRVGTDSTIRECVSVAPRERNRPKYPGGGGTMCRAVVAEAGHLTVEDSTIWVDDAGKVMVAETNIANPGSLTIRNTKVRPGADRGWQDRPRIDASNIQSLTGDATAPEGVPQSAEEAATGNASGGFSINGGPPSGFGEGPSGSNAEDPCG